MMAPEIDGWPIGYLMALEPARRRQCYWRHAHQTCNGELTEAERSEIEARRALWSGLTFFHGGPPGLNQILPASMTGAALLGGDDLDAARRCETVYLTQSRTIAREICQLRGGGVVYRVQPRGEVEPNPAAWRYFHLCLADGLDGVSWSDLTAYVAVWRCAAAEALEVVEVIAE